MMDTKNSPARHCYKIQIVFSVVSMVVSLISSQPLSAKTDDLSATSPSHTSTGREMMNDHEPAIIQEFKLTTEELKTFEGYYQFEQNPEMYLQFSVKENGLIAQEVWSGKQFFILPKSSLEFYSQKEIYPAKFTKDNKGMITQVLVFNRDVWKKVKDYKPRTVAKLSPQKLKAFEGKYTFEFEPGKAEYLQITAKEDHLILKEMWSGNEIKFKPSSDLEFFNEARGFPLKFTKDNTGAITQVLAFNRDLWTRVKE